MSEDGKEVTTEVLPATVGSTNTLGDLVSLGATVVRIENESMVSVAVQRPRNEQKALEGALAELDAMPEEAGAAYYSIPYEDRQQGKTVFVEGPSIKAAMTIARRWGNCSTGARIAAEDADGYTVDGVFIDVESNFRVQRSVRVSKWFKAKGGKVYLLSVDRQIMAVQAGISKAIRNAVLAGMPPYIVSSYFKRAKALVASGGKKRAGEATLKKGANQGVVGQILAAFAAEEVGQADLEGLLQKPAAEWTGDDVASLRGLWSAIKDGQTTVAEEFSRVRQKRNGVENPVPTEVPFTPQDVVAGTVKTQERLI